MRLFLELALLFGASAFGNLKAGCGGQSQPGPPNLNPIDTSAPRFVKQVPYGKLYAAGTGENQFDLLHVWGTPYQNGLAQANLLGAEKMVKFIKEAYAYVEQSIIKAAANNTRLAAILKMGIDVALDLSYEQTKDYIKPYVMQEIQGLADGSGGNVSLTDIRNVQWLGELTRGACSMFGAWGDATPDHNLLQLRALDWNVDGPFKNYAAVVVYHPNEGDGHPWANVGFSGWTASITGMSSSSLAMSEIGVSYPDKSFGNETYLARGYPFGYIIRDILQFDNTVDDATNRITNTKRTCDLILGCGDGKSNSFKGYQYSPHVANVMNDQNLLPVADWHPRIANIVYWGMDWICPNDNSMLSTQLKAFYGNITVENTIRDITSYVTTGNLHIAIYDHPHDAMFVAFARTDSADPKGPAYAYQRPFTRLDLAALWKEQPPTL